MKILIATAVYYPMVNGVAVFSHNLAAGLSKRGNEVVVVCPSQTGKNYTRTEDGVKVCHLKSVQAKVYPDQIHDVPAKKKLLGKEMPHLFYKHSLRVSVFPARQIKKIMKDAVENEDKADPMTDEQLMFLLKEKGYPIARRTVAKYREQLGIPVGRMRKKI